jgi:hypothetical protein
MVLLALAAVIGTGVTYAETYPGGTDNGKTSRIKQASDDLVSLGYGSTSNTPDWGALWNRIVTAGKWTPQGDVTPGDVRTGKKFYNGNRSQQTGTMVTVTACPTQGWHDSSGSAVKAANCVSDWSVASPAMPGDDKKDPVTGLVWSTCLLNSSGVNNFSSNGSCSSTYSWDNSAVDNGGKTAMELCAAQSNGWRMPTQKELMQAYIDGVYFNLTTTNFSFRSATENSTTTVWSVFLATGTTSNSSTKSGTSVLRCVR